MGKVFLSDLEPTVSSTRFERLYAAGARSDCGVVRFDGVTHDHRQKQSGSL
jgi:hypothetical protein